MIYNLIYRPRFTSPSNHLGDGLTDAGLALKWVVPTGMSEKNIIADFERRFSGARVVSLEPTEVTA
jgi:hypothetical protein